MKDPMSILVGSKDPADKTSPLYAYTQMKKVIFETQEEHNLDVLSWNQTRNATSVSCLTILVCIQFQRRIKIKEFLFTQTIKRTT